MTSKVSLKSGRTGGLVLLYGQQQRRRTKNLRVSNIVVIYCVQQERFFSLFLNCAISNFSFKIPPVVFCVSWHKMPVVSRVPTYFYSHWTLIALNKCGLGCFTFDAYYKVITQLLKTFIACSWKTGPLFHEFRETICWYTGSKNSWTDWRLVRAKQTRETEAEMWFP